MLYGPLLTMRKILHAINDLPHAEEAAEGGRLEARTMLMSYQEP